MGRKGQKIIGTGKKKMCMSHASDVRSIAGDTDDATTPECTADVRRSRQLSRTLKVVCRRVGTGMARWDLPIRPKEDAFLSVPNDDSSQNNETDEQIGFNKEPLVIKKAMKTEPMCYQTPQRDPETSPCCDESFCEEVVDTESTIGDPSFQLDVLNLGYKISTESKEPSTCSAPGHNIEGTVLEDKTSAQKSFRVTAPMYVCPDDTTRKTEHPDAKKKTSAKKRRSAKRRLCQEVTDVPDAEDPRRANVVELIPDIVCEETIKTRSQMANMTNAEDSPCLALSPGLQIDTLNCLRNGTVKNAYHRIVPVCLSDSSYKPELPIPYIQSAIAARLTYDNSGKLTVVETKESISPGIYRAVMTGIAKPHQCLKRFVAMESLLSPCTSVSNLSPHSQYFVLNEMHAIPRDRWREKLSATVVKLRLEDYLHTANFHVFVLPLLLWNGEDDIWTAWTKEPVVKFSAAKRKCKRHAHRAQLDKARKCHNRAITVNSLESGKNDSIRRTAEEENTTNGSVQVEKSNREPKCVFRKRSIKRTCVKEDTPDNETCSRQKITKTKTEISSSAVFLSHNDAKHSGRVNVLSKGRCIRHEHTDKCDEVMKEWFAASKRKRVHSQSVAAPSGAKRARTAEKKPDSIEKPTR